MPAAVHDEEDEAPWPPRPEKKRKGAHQDLFDDGTDGEHSLEDLPPPPQSHLPQRLISFTFDEASAVPSLPVITRQRSLEGFDASVYGAYRKFRAVGGAVASYENGGVGVDLDLYGGVEDGSDYDTLYFGGDLYPAE